MDSRDHFDIALLVLAGFLAYTETFGFADPQTTLDEVIAILAGIHIGVYLILGGVSGIFFVTYLVFYLPKKDAQTVKR